MSERVTINSPIDVHTHLREPGTNKSETIESGTYAARAGGYQAVFDMPNNPGRPTHSEERLIEKQTIAARDSHVDIGFYAGIDLTDPDIDQIPRMIGRAAGLKLYMGETTGNARTYTLDDAREIIDLWTSQAKEHQLHAPIIFHAEGAIGAQAVRYTINKHHHAHWAHLSSAKEAEYAKRFTKYYSEYFTSEVTPHHLTMNQINADQYGWPGGRMMPSLKREFDRDAILKAFADGDIQILGTDHAPHPLASKLKAEHDNPHGHTGVDCTTCYGISGIEFALPIMMRQVQLGRVTLDRLQDAVYTQPLRMLGIKAADMTATTTLKIEAYRIEKGDLQGGSDNTPYINMMAGAKVVKVTNRRRKPRVFSAQPRSV